VRGGDSVRWTAAAGSFEAHNVREVSKLFYSGPVENNIDFKVRFSAGTFRYFCELHVSAGMRGAVNVPVTVSSAPRGLPFTVRWATGKSRTGGKYDVQFRVGSARKWRTWKTNVTTGSGVFGKGRKPVAVVNGKKYSFRARSQNKKGASGWSPPRSFRT
jgi:hypothetical protein